MRLHRFFHPLRVAGSFLVLLLNSCAHQGASSDISPLGQSDHPPAVASPALASSVPGTQATPALPDFPASDFLLATGRGDLSRGTLTCQRTADMAARAELAKLIRVHVKEHSTDRVRERTSRSVEQDIEVVREEQADQLLQEVRIVQRTVDKNSGTCTSTAAMPIRLMVTAPPPSGTGNTSQEPTSLKTPSASSQ